MVPDGIAPKAPRIASYVIAAVATLAKRNDDCCTAACRSGWRSQGAWLAYPPLRAQPTTKAKAMHIDTSVVPFTNGPPPEYETTMADLERRAALGELTLEQARREIFELRERLALDAAALTLWAMHSRI